MSTILHFPDLNTLRLAITSGVVPASVSLAGAVFREEGAAIAVQPAESLGKTALAALARLNVRIAQPEADLDGDEVCAWPQILPVHSAGTPSAELAQTPVIFDLRQPELLPELVNEMLRLGNDRQGFRWLGDGPNKRVLLRVIGPPYYSLLRALDQVQAQNLRAYVERGQRVWVEIGHTHALVEQIKLPAGKMLLLHAPRTWIFLDEAPFRDIYEIIEFLLPHREVRWQESEEYRRLTVPLRLDSGGHTAEPAELWVFPEEDLDQFDAFVRDADDQLLARLAFAIGQRDGRSSLVLRVRPGGKHGRSGPPVLVLKALAFRSYLKLPNLFVPMGSRLLPPLRRDAIRKLLAEDPAQITWLVPQADGAFLPESLPDEAFRPLEDWVDYILDREQQSLQAWMQAARFDFESFVCRDDAPVEPKPARPAEPKKPTSPERDPTAAKSKKTPSVREGKPTPRDQHEFGLSPAAKLSELQQRLTQLEKQFLSQEGPLDSPDRRALWPELAAVNTALGNSADAAVCWLHAFWDGETVPSTWSWVWARSEAKLPQRDVTLGDLDRLLTPAEPTAVQLRALAASVFWSATQRPPTPALLKRLNAVRQYLEKHDQLLPVRAVWLVWHALTRLSGGDVLGLARVRDRLLDRLLEQGLTAELDLPSFMRLGGRDGGERYRLIRDRVNHLHGLADAWLKECYSRDKNPAEASRFTRAYADLTFAFGLARLGEAEHCRQLQEKATAILGDEDDVHSLLLQMYCYRINQVLQGQPHAGPFPQEYLDYLEGMPRPRDKVSPRYIVDSRRKFSRILEPQEIVNPYQSVVGWADDISREISEILRLQERNESADAFLHLLSRPYIKKSPVSRLRVLVVAIDRGLRIGEAFTLAVLPQVIPTLDALPDLNLELELLRQVACLLERALFSATHYDKQEYVSAFVNRFLELLHSLGGEVSVENLDIVAGQCFRGLRRLGLQSEITLLLEKTTEVLCRGHRLETLPQVLQGKWPATLRTLLHIAAGWLYFGKEANAKPILGQAWRSLLEKPMESKETASKESKDRAALVCTYIATLGQAPMAGALHQIERLFRIVGRLYDAYGTNSHFSRTQLDVVEAVVLAVVSEDFALGGAARRWLDEDEFLVRRRIHRDLDVVRKQAGV